MSPPPYLIGPGYDLHRLQPGGQLVLGGVVVSTDIAPIAHSDGSEAFGATAAGGSKSPAPFIAVFVDGLRSAEPPMKVGTRGAKALMTSPDSEPGYRALIPPGAQFENGVSARFINRVGLYRPGRSARKVSAPILFCICENDTVAPARPSGLTANGSASAITLDSARCAGIASIHLELRASNDAARRFYRAMGFYETVLVPGYYRSGEGRKEGALRMLRVLRNPGPVPYTWRPPRSEEDR